MLHAALRAAAGRRFTFHRVRSVACGTISSLTNAALPGGVGKQTNPPRRSPASPRVWSKSLGGLYERARAGRRCRVREDTCYAWRPRTTPPILHAAHLRPSPCNISAVSALLSPCRPCIPSSFSRAQASACCARIVSYVEPESPTPNKNEQTAPRNTRRKIKQTRSKRDMRGRLAS